MGALSHNDKPVKPPCPPPELGAPEARLSLRKLRVAGQPNPPEIDTTKGEQGPPKVEWVSTLGYWVCFSVTGSPLYWYEKGAWEQWKDLPTHLVAVYNAQLKLDLEDRQTMQGSASEKVGIPTVVAQ